MKRRTLLAQALVADPDILLLDEPTNHLSTLSRSSAIALISCPLRYGGRSSSLTHDRAFLVKLKDFGTSVSTGAIFVDCAW